MKSKKIFVLLTALALSLAACNMGGGNSSNSGNESKSSADTTSQSQSTDSSSSSQGGTDTVAVTALTLNKTELSIEATKSETLTVTVSPENASNTKVNWVSSDPTVATVSSLGKVSALKVGTATITVSSQSNPEVTATCAVTVTEEGGKYGSLNKPKTVAEALAIAAEECKEDGDATAGEIYIKGIVTKNPSYNSEKGYASNIYLKDALTDEKDILVFTADCDLLKLPYQNDTVILHGYVKNYKGTIEFATVTPKGATKGVNPAIDSVTRGTSSISYFITHATLNAQAPSSGKNNSEFNFTVTPESGYAAKIVTVNGEKITAQADGSFKAYVKGNTSVAINVFEQELDIQDAVAAYQGSTTNMVQDENNAKTVGLDESLFNVNTDTAGGNKIGLNAAGNIRLYNNYKATNEADRVNGNILTITSRRALVKRIIVTLAPSSVATLADLEVKANGAVITGDSGVYEFSASTFTLKNVSNASASCQLHISSIAIFYIIREEVHATGIAVAPKTAEVEVGESVKLAATTDPANATDDIAWSSSDNAKATVDGDGKVTGVAEGTVTITAKISDTILDTATVTVKPARIINYGTAEAPLTVAQAKAVLDEYPDDESKQPLFVKGIVSSNEAFNADYDNGAIWLESDDGSNAKEFELYSCEIDSQVENAAQYKVLDGLKGLEVVATGYGKIFRGTYELTNVTRNKERINPKVLSVATPAIKSLSLNKETLNLTVGGEETLVVSKNPANGTGTIVWSSSEPTIATVDQEGKVTAVAAGEAVITAKVSDDVKVTCAVTVAAAAVAAESVTLDKETLELYVGYEGQLAATVAPENATGAPVWESSDPTKATVDQTGKVTAVAAGTAVITATHGQVSDSCTVTVSELNLGSLEAPITPAAALKIAANLGLKAGDFSPAKAYVQGTVEYTADTFYSTSKGSTYFGKWNVVDGENKLYVVNSKDNAPEVYAGDTAVISGFLSYEAANGYELLKDSNSVYPKVEKATARATGTIGVDAEIAHAEVQELSATSGLNGSNFTFKVAPADGYRVVSVMVKNSFSNLNQTLTAVEGVYTGVVKGNVKIYVEVEESTGQEAVTLLSADLTNGTSCTDGFTITTTAAKKTGYYQDQGSANSAENNFIVKRDTALFDAEPSQIKFTASLGAGSDKNPLDHNVEVVLVDAEGNEIAATKVTLTNKLTNAAANYNVVIPYAANACGVKLMHVKESSWNARYYSFSLSYIA